MSPTYTLPPCNVPGAPPLNFKLRATENPSGARVTESDDQISLWVRDCPSVGSRHHQPKHFAWCRDLLPGDRTKLMAVRVGYGSVRSERVRCRPQQCGNAPERPWVCSITACRDL